MKKIYKWILGVTVFITFGGCTTIKNNVVCNTPTQKMGEAVQLHNGDAKFYNGEIYTSIGCLSRFDLQGNLLEKYDEIASNWIDIDDDVIIYGNMNKEVGIVQLDSKKNIVNHQVIMQSDDLLMIDPTIVKIDNVYYATVTKVYGAVNNADNNIENGVYTIELYQSEDLSSWNYVSEVAKAKQNLEDTDIFYEDHQLYFCYEKEVVDKGMSELCFKKSLDMGKTWTEEKTILEAKADQEPGKYERTKDGYVVYYSSDKEYPGESYMGGKLYCALLDRNMEVKEKDIEIPMETEKGILLYDVYEENDRQYFLIAKNYLTDCDMVIEARDLSR